MEIQNENMPFYNDGKYNIIEDKLKLIHNLEEQYKKLLNEAYARFVPDEI